jgi:glycosyltransferase involved in cell wall biosynthesis
MKIAQIVPTLDRSGAEKQVLLLCRELAKRGHEVEVGVLTRLGPLEGEFRSSGIPVAVIGKPLKADPFALRRLSRWMKGNRFDVVQSWLFAANAYSRAAARLAFGGRDPQRPVIVATEMAVDLWKSPWHFRVDRLVQGWCDTVVGNSQAVVDFYRDKVGIEASRLSMIHSGIDPGEAGPIDENARRAARKTLGLADDAGPVLFFAGRLAEQKRVEDLLKAADILQHLYPNIRLLIAGEGPLRASLTEFARGVDLGEKAKFLGLRDDMDTLYAAADIVVLPSSYEGLPNVVMEAQLRAIPVVASAAPGTIELVEHDATGLLFPVGDSTGLARQIERVVSDEALARRLGAAGRTMIAEKFTTGIMTDRFESLYRELREKRKG